MGNEGVIWIHRSVSFKSLSGRQAGRQADRGDDGEAGGGGC